MNLSYHCSVNFSPSSSTIPGGGWLGWTGTLVTEETQKKWFNKGKQMVIMILSHFFIATRLQTWWVYTIESYTKFLDPEGVPHHSQNLMGVAHSNISRKCNQYLSVTFWWTNRPTNTSRNVTTLDPWVSKFVRRSTRCQQTDNFTVQWTCTGLTP